MTTTRRFISPNSEEAKQLRQELTTLHPNNDPPQQPSQPPPLSNPPTTTKPSSSSSTPLNTIHPTELLQSATQSTTKVNHWREHPFAVGLVEPTWTDELRRFVGSPANEEDDANGPNRTCCEDATSSQIDPTCGCLVFSAFVFGGRVVRWGERVGNMTVLRGGVVTVRERKTVEEMEEDGLLLKGEKEMEMEEDGGNGTDDNSMYKIVRRQRIDVVIGPYWPCLVFVTFPLVIGVSIVTAVKAVFVPGQNELLQMVWSCLTMGLIAALFQVGCRDPGIVRKHRENPLLNDSSFREHGGGGSSSGSNSSSRELLSKREEELEYRRRLLKGSGGGWVWNDQAFSYKPRNSYYDPDCAVVVEEFDHTCPWTGTAIGKKNMCAFQCFVGLVFVCLPMDILLLAAKSI